LGVNDETNEKSCFFCGEAIPETASRCKYCGSLLGKKEAGSEISDTVLHDEAMLSNSMKVFLIVLYTLIPCIGQIAGVIHGITMFNSGKADKRSFGKALIIAMVIVFLIMSVLFYMFAVMLITIIYY
jgi:predicted small integral membrane protein